MLDYLFDISGEGSVPADCTKIKSDSCHLDFMDRDDTHSSVHSMTLHGDSSKVSDVLVKQ